MLLAGWATGGMCPSTAQSPPGWIWVQQGSELDTGAGVPGREGARLLWLSLPCALAAQQGTAGPLLLSSEGAVPTAAVISRANQEYVNAS